MEPRVLLLDEPFGSLDAKVRKELRQWLRRLHDEIHIASIFVTHDQDEAMEVADRVVLMNRGRVEQTGLTQEVYESPVTAFACSFLGAVNQLPGRVDGGALRIGDATVPLAERCGADGGEDVIAYARPHDLDIVVDGDAREGLPASVRRVLVSGAIARVELMGAARVDGDTAPPPRFEVELTRERLAQLNLQPGQAVRLTSSRLKVFPLERQS